MQPIGIVNSVFNSMTYIIPIGDDKECCLVDCGDVGKVIEEGWRVKSVLLTHAHFDHIYGLPLLLEKFPDVLIYTNEWGKAALADDRMNMSHYHESPIRIDCSNVLVIGEGDIVCGFNVYETPGHNPSCICYLNDEIIFTGDAYIPDCKVVANLPNSDKIQVVKSLEILKSLIQGKLVCPGHSAKLKF